MASDHAQGTPSPSTSSIFLPLGRISRRNSKSSLNNQVDRDTLNEALDHIHTAASNSQSLTVFNDYTNPPAPSSASESKGLAEELQGGLSGLYNKIIASVSGTKGDPEALDAADTPRQVVADGTPPAKLATAEATREHLTVVPQLPSSNLSSRIQSPVATSFDLSTSESRTKSSDDFVRLSLVERSNEVATGDWILEERFEDGNCGTTVRCSLVASAVASFAGGVPSATTWRGVSAASKASGSPFVPLTDAMILL